ncbi:hypothetical protein M6B38_285455 [Iris pallida]|uniref:Uncharacterized protein n=1 Tax=Iris pallida TaxID=29817 RepID=A0AAX6DWT4_IRIPA|nr:hypothetical protein M6B38_222560 [Iris pallida]KAJ6812305.1 hypothetical protein M6B38_149425 [Iris pallida]KAJ6845858.1 hypothetical protein M6B38_285455 [Iris pallida]
MDELVGGRCHALVFRSHIRPQIRRSPIFERHRAHLWSHHRRVVTHRAFSEPCRRTAAYRASHVFSVVQVLVPPFRRVLVRLLLHRSEHCSFPLDLPVSPLLFCFFVFLNNF